MITIDPSTASECIAHLDNYAKHVACKETKEAREALYEAIKSCPHPVLLPYLQHEYDKFRVAQPWNLWSWLAQAFGRRDRAQANVKMITPG